MSSAELLDAGRDGRYTGRLANGPSIVTELAFGDLIEFGPEHVIAIEYTVAELGYHPSEWAHIDARILRDDRAPDIVVHAQPVGAGDERHDECCRKEACPVQSHPRARFVALDG
ncbi:hypothetical protein [Pseudonocardia nigra]|uniref:hypothetical protein n=1 Tax=Pseudonocardia nigra TaxID=1921578 RepID=UPI001C5F8C64|nr:hypothetical protein [Pseudonocardia nigra]